MNFLKYTLVPFLVVPVGFFLVGIFLQTEFWELWLFFLGALIVLPATLMFFLARYLYKTTPYVMWHELGLAFIFLAAGILGNYAESFALGAFLIVFFISFIASVYKLIKNIFKPHPL